MPGDKAVFALRAALWELDRLVERGHDRRKISRRPAPSLLNYSKLWVQTLSRRLGYAIDGEFYGRNDLVTELAERLPKLTVDQVNAAVRKHLKTDGMKVAIVARDAAGLRELSLPASRRRSSTTPREPRRTSWPRTSRSPPSRSRTCRCGSCRWSRCLRNSG